MISPDKRIHAAPHFFLIYNETAQYWEYAKITLQKNKRINFQANSFRAEKDAF